MVCYATYDDDGIYQISIICFRLQNIQTFKLVWSHCHVRRMNEETLPQKIWNGVHLKE